MKNEEGTKIEIDTVEKLCTTPSCATALNFVLGKYTLKDALGKWDEYPLDIDHYLPKDYSINDFQQIFNEFINNHTNYHIEVGDYDPTILTEFLDETSEFLIHIRCFIRGYKLRLEISEELDDENAFQILKEYLPPDITKEDFEKLYDINWIDDKFYLIEYINNFVVY